MRKYFVIFFLIYTQVIGYNYEDLKKDQIFLSLLDLKFPKIKESLYSKYNEDIYWKFFVESSSRLNLLYNTKRYQNGQERYSLKFHGQLKDLSIIQFNNLNNFFLFLINNKKDNEGIGFLFLTKFYFLLCEVENSKFLIKVKDLFKYVFNKKYAQKEGFRLLLNNFVHMYLDKFNRQDQTYLKEIITNLFNLSFYLNYLNLKNDLTGLVYSYLVGIKFDMGFLQRLNVLTEEDKRKIKKDTLSRLKIRELLQKNTKKEKAENLKRYSKEISKIEWLQ